MTSEKIVGHKTISDGRGGYYHEPLYADEAEKLRKRSEQEDERRKELMPDERSAILLFFYAWLRLKDFGWRDAMYCPKDGRLFEVIEAGSTGVFRCHYEGEWPKGFYTGDVMSPILFKPIDARAEVK